MFSKRQEITSTLTVLPDELLDEVAGGAGKPTFYEFTTPDGDTVCRPNKGNAGGKLVNTGVVCTPGGEEA